MTPPLTPTEQQQLAKLLPDVTFNPLHGLVWLPNGLTHGRSVLPTEHAHLVSLVEEGLNYEEQMVYTEQMYALDGFYRPCDCDSDIDYEELFKYIHATPSHRLAALVKMKGVQ